MTGGGRQLIVVHSTTQWYSVVVSFFGAHNSVSVFASVFWTSSYIHIDIMILQREQQQQRRVESSMLSKASTKGCRHERRRERRSFQKSNCESGQLQKKHKRAPPAAIQLWDASSFIGVAIESFSIWKLTEQTQPVMLLPVSNTASSGSNNSAVFQNHDNF